MNFDRISQTIDVERMQHSHATIIGGAYAVGSDLVRCGLGSLTLIDYDIVTESNPARQDFSSTDVGLHKVEVAAALMRRINPEVEVDVMIRDFCSISDDEFETNLGHTDLIINAADYFPAQARGCLLAVRFGIPGLWIGLYRQGRAGEIVYWVLDVTDACYRCICSSRYRVFESGQAAISSAGGTIFDMRIVDGIAGQLAVGILTRGAPNRMGRLIDKLGNRNLLQVKIDPDYRLGDKDIFSQYLGTHPANFSFTTIALPMERDENCPDCGGIERREYRDEENRETVSDG